MAKNIPISRIRKVCKRMDSIQMEIKSADLGVFYSGARWALTPESFRRSLINRIEEFKTYFRGGLVELATSVHDAFVKIRDMKVAGETLSNIIRMIIEVLEQEIRYMVSVPA